MPDLITVTRHNSDSIKLMASLVMGLEKRTPARENLQDSILEQGQSWA